MVGAVVFVSFLALAGAKVSYDGYKGYLIETPTDAAVKALYALRGLGVEILSEPSRKIEIAIPPEKLDLVLKRLSDAKLVHTVLYENLQAEIDAQERESKAGAMYARFRSGGVHAYSIATYFPTYSQTEDWLYGLKMKYRKLASVFSMGKSYEGRDQSGLKISTGGRNKEVIWLDAAIHAREWATVPTALYVATKLLENYGSPNPIEATDDLLNKYDFYILPIVNPDGYVHSHTEDRLWRKNRKGGSRGRGRCAGVDLNRNFGYKWGASGVSHYPCDPDYLGSSAFSEPETQNMRDYLLQFKDRFAMYFTIHACGELLFIPWAYSNTDHFEAETEHLRVANAMRDAIRQQSGPARKTYSVGKAGDLIYNAAGGTFDWVYAKAGAKYALAAELSPNLYSQSCFRISPRKVPAIAEEFYQGFIAAIKAM